MRKYRVIFRKGWYVAQARWFGFLWLDLFGLVGGKNCSSLEMAKLDISNAIASRKGPRVVHEEEG
jgi:hypothetical protein